MIVHLAKAWDLGPSGGHSPPDAIAPGTSR